VAGFQAESIGTRVVVTPCSEAIGGFFARLCRARVETCLGDSPTIAFCAIRLQLRIGLSFDRKYEWIGIHCVLTINLLDEAGFLPT
jgi:hypothetical protein